jgi:alkyldihydroxyacetonephosphate synthase
MLVSRLPDGTVRTDAETLRERAIDSWSLALLRRVRGDELPVPAAVVFPACTQEVATVLAWASETSTAVIPRGAGSGVCGGAQAETRSVVLDLSRMNKIIDIDLVSQTISVEAGLRGDQLEQALAEHGLTAGLYPQSIAISTVGGWIAASSAGQASTGFGAIEDVLLGLTAVLPSGEILRCRPVPQPGPGCHHVALGHPGKFRATADRM